MDTFLRFTLLLMIFALPGCGGGDSVPIYDLSGTVTLDGNPVKYGRIDFVADSSKGNNGAKGYATIIDGKYDTSSSTDKGTTGGAYIAQITAYDQKPVETEDETVEVPTTKMLCVAYPVEKDLPEETTIINFELSDEALGYDNSKAQARRSPNEP
ncbi:hypothetical protein [uncultured Rubinisphaera sp.]|uniref:hypothetical protein n=1 Tax=uncultured Rubinisphaera sp. TaxID=1678686 RepID=UPI0030DDCBA2